MLFRRILIIHSQKINKSDSIADSAVLRALFKTWPKDRLFQIYNSHDNQDEGFCSKYYRFSFNDRFGGNVFLRIKQFINNIKHLFIKVKNITEQNVSEIQKRNTAINKYLHAGLQDIIFFPKVNSNLRYFIETINPDIIYCQGYSLKLIILTLLISKRFNIPYIVHPLDDWAYNSIIDTNFHKLISPIWKYWTKKLFQNACLRLVVNSYMANEYFKRYKNQWYIIPVILDFPKIIQGKENKICNWKNNASKGSIAFCYTGSLGAGRFKSFEWIAKELIYLSKLHQKEYHIFIYTNNNKSLEAKILGKYPNITIEPPVHSDYVLSLLVAADILVLCESFFYNDAKTNKFVLSSKVPVYTKSKKPILACGSEINGTIRNAVTNKWAYTITKPLLQYLEIALNDIHNHYDKYAKVAFNFWNNNLEPEKVRYKFINYINSIQLKDT